MWLQVGGKVGGNQQPCPELGSLGTLSAGHLHENAMSHTAGTALRGVYLTRAASETPCALGINQRFDVLRSWLYTGHVEHKCVLCI